MIEIVFDFFLFIQICIYYMRNLAVSVCNGSNCMIVFPIKYSNITINILCDNQ